MDIDRSNYIFFAQEVCRYYILVSIIILFYLSYNNKALLYKPIFFLFIPFLLLSIFNVLDISFNYKIIIILVFMFYLLVVCVNSNHIFKASYDMNCINRIEGYVIKDQSKTKKDFYYFKIRTDKAYLKDNSCISVKGDIPILFNKDYSLLFLTPVIIDVEYCKDIDLFKAKQVQVLEKNNNLLYLADKIIFSIRDNRVYILKKIKSYIHCPLARMLLLGRCDQQGFIYKDYALKLGCAHLLALSGMHLSIIILFFSKILTKFFPKKVAKYVSIIFVVYFIYITGPIPSLIRSFIMFMLGFFTIKGNLRSELVLLFSAIVQVIFFPCTFISAGSLFSYGALSAIFIYSSIYKVKNKIISAMMTTVFAILVTYPLSISLGGSWCILSIILAPLLTIFITFEMFLAIVILINSVIVDFFYYYIFRNTPSIFRAILELGENLIKEINYYLHVILNYNERIIREAFVIGEKVALKLPSFLINEKGYIFFVVIVLTTTGVYLYSRVSFKFRSKQKHELGFPIRK